MEAHGIAALLMHSSELRRTGIFNGLEYMISKLIHLKSMGDKERYVLWGGQPSYFRSLQEVRASQHPDLILTESVRFLEAIQDVRGSSLPCLLTKVIALEYIVQLKQTAIEEGYRPANNDIQADYARVIDALHQAAEKAHGYEHAIREVIRLYEARVNAQRDAELGSPGLNPWDPSNRHLRRRIHTSLPAAWQRLHLGQPYAPEGVIPADEVSVLLGFQSTETMRDTLDRIGIKIEGHAVPVRYVGVLAGVLTSKRYAG